MTKNVIILGSTGSIGTQTLEVIDKLDDYNVLALGAGKNIELLRKQVEKYNPKFICIQDEKDIKLVKEFFGGEIFFGEGGLVELSKLGDILVVATSGVASLRAVFEGIKNRKKIALANKETLVMAGDIVMREARKNNVTILPIDSEHSAILQCIQNKDFDNKKNNSIKNLWITASGGPFLNKTRKEMETFKAEDALKHPQWSMGKKITIDCSTLANKGLEVIEAHHLFDIDYENIKVVIHPQSLVHSAVEFIDGSFLAQMGVASMHIPIQYALTYPNREFGIKSESFSLFDKHLEFLKPDYEKFPILKIALDCAKMGGIAPCVFNAANEVAVYKFLRGEIGFLDIEKSISKTLEKTTNIVNPTLEEIFEADKLTREALK